MTTTNTDIMGTIRARADELGLSQADVSRLSGIPPHKVNTYWRGHTLPGYKSIQKLMDAMGLVIVWKGYV